jgi:hypothetical protein
MVKELKLTFLGRTRGQRNMQFTDYVLRSSYHLPTYRAAGYAQAQRYEANELGSFHALRPAGIDHGQH